MDNEYFEHLLTKAHAEKKRTDEKYGSKEEGGTNKARLVACIIENVGSFLDAQREGDRDGAEEYYVRALAHYMSLSEHIRQTKKGPQYLY